MLLLIAVTLHSSSQAGRCLVLPRSFLVLQVVPGGVSANQAVRKGLEEVPKFRGDLFGFRV